MTTHKSLDHGTLLDLMKAYVDTAKTFVQLASAGLALPIVLSAQVLSFFGRASAPGVSSGSGSSLQLSTTVRIGIFVSWLFFMLAIGAGVFYQYLAIKSAEYEINPDGVYVSKLVRPLILSGPGRIYGVMVITFYFGALTVVVYSAFALLGV